MHAALQPGDRSPKQVNTPTSTVQLKSGSDSGQNSGSTFPAQIKGKKRDRADHVADSVKRERSSRANDEDYVQFKPGINLKSEIARITEKGGVNDVDGVEKLIHLMQSDRMERNKDLFSRSMLAGVMAATDKVECLDRFVQLRGLPVLDEWLQEIHKGKIGDSNNLKDGDKSVEEFVLVLLRALDKLPVDLHALQTCNIGRSVNHLRSHKNLEIQRKARSLVDTWKKRVEAEMNSIDTKSGSAQAISVWPSKSRLPEASQGGSKTPSGSDVALKSSSTQNYASKTTPPRSSHVDSQIKSTTSSPGPLKSPASGKESQPRVSSGGTHDAPLIREDRSSSSNQSNNCCQSISEKEDGKSTSAALLTVNKISTSTIRTRKNSGTHGVPVAGGQKETSSTRGSLAQKSAVLEKSQPSSTFGRAVEGPVSEGSSHKLIVTLSNRVRSPAHGVSGESLEDPTLMSSSALLDKHDQLEHTSKDKTDLWQNDDSKDLLTGSGKDAGSPVALPEEERSVTTDDSRRLSEGPPKNQLKVTRSQASSFSPMNALIESCAKYSGANSSLSLEDDVGMNLLASVATGEMSRSDLASPIDSTEISTPAVEENCGTDEEKSKSSPENYVPAVPRKFSIDAECDNKEQSALECSLVSEDGSHMPKKLSVKFTGDKECAPSLTPEGVQTREGNKHLDSSSLDLRNNIHHKLDTVEKSNVKTDTTSTEIVMDGKFDEEIQEDTSRVFCSNGILNRITQEIKAMVEEKAGTCMDEGKSMTEIGGSKQLCEDDNKKDLTDGSSMGNYLQQKLAAINVSGFAERENSEKLQQIACGENSVSKGGDEITTGKSVEADSKNFGNKSEMPNFSSEEVVRNADVGRHSLATSCSRSDDLKNQKGAHVESKKMLEHVSPSERGCGVDLEAPQKVEFKGPKSSSIQTDEARNRDSIVAEVCSSAAGQTHTDSKIKFDLNEGFSADDGKYGEPVSLVSFGSTNAHIVNSVPFSVNSVSASNSASITVTAAAKGPFVPPVRSKRELGWKGSAATSAFRPAEPRKFLETAFGSISNACYDASISKHGRIPLDFDLNVPDERVLEEIASRDSAMAVGLITGFVSNHTTSLNDSLSSALVFGSGGLDLDLNRVDDATENAYCSTSNYQKGEGSIARIKPLGGLSTGNVRRDFDLNDGPIVDNASAEKFSIRKQVKGGIPSQLHPAGLRMNCPGVGSYSSWYPPGNTYSTVTIPTILPDRGDPPFSVFPPGAPQRAFGPIGVSTLTPDVYRGSVLASSPAVPFSSSPFQFSVFPFGTTFPLPSATFPVGANSYADSSSGPRLFAPPVNSQFLAQVGPVASQFQRPYVVNLPDGSSNGMLENHRKWGRQGLDLNAGPGTMEEVREDSFTQHPVASAQVVVDEQAQMYPVPGGISKRKEPEGMGDDYVVSQACRFSPALHFNFGDPHTTPSENVPAVNTRMGIQENGRCAENLPG